MNKYNINIALKDISFLPFEPQFFLQNLHSFSSILIVPIYLNPPHNRQRLEDSKDFFRLAMCLKFDNILNVSISRYEYLSIICLSILFKKFF